MVGAKNPAVQTLDTATGEAAFRGPAARPDTSQARAFLALDTRRVVDPRGSRAGGENAIYFSNMSRVRLSRPFLYYKRARVYRPDRFLTVRSIARPAIVSTRLFDAAATSR